MLFDSSYDELPVDASCSMLASMDSWDTLIGFTEQQIDDSPLSVTKKYGMKLAVEELLSNIIRANSSSLSTSSPSSVELRRFTDPSGEAFLLLEIKDNGLPFDPHFEALDEGVLDAPLHDRPIGGLGLLLVKKSVDDVGYQSRDSCNIYRLLSRG